jgi:uncharacterized protein (DUF488 family)
MTLFTIGFTRKTAEQFFEKIKSVGIKRVVDIRLKNTSQLAGFAKSEDLAYFLKKIGDIDYVHIPELAPDKELLELIKKKNGSWTAYETGYTDLLTARKIDGKFLKGALNDRDCLLCSEHTPERCHRRIIAERFKSINDQAIVVHL